MNTEFAYTFALGFVLLVVFWYFFNSARTMRARGRDLISSGIKDLKSGRQKIRDGRKSMRTGTLLLLAVTPLVVIIIVALLRACAAVSQ